MEFKQNNTLGQIVSKFPRAADVFHDYNIDYCCGGHRTLSDVSKEQSLNVKEVIDALHKHYHSSTSSSTDWEKAPYLDLINQILQAHHAYLNQNLPMISEQVKTILRVHGQNHPELMKVYQLFHRLKTDMDMHLIKEETIQYPAIEKYLETNKLEDLENAIQVIDELEEEHEDVGGILKSLRSITDGFNAPDDACQTFISTYENLEILEKNTFTHIHLENNILFPRVKKEI
ncbi:iron-sulfur cluster repair di-iron protein [Mycoplasmatota bacterium]|nr:iron-sulfur cluster repair di-iron protein [Mycoplasmatota bacterium]